MFALTICASTVAGGISKSCGSSVVGSTVVVDVDSSAVVSFEVCVELSSITEDVEFSPVREFRVALSGIALIVVDSISFGLSLVSLNSTNFTKTMSSENAIKIFFISVLFQLIFSLDSSIESFQ